jgi:hypothetical protein
MSFHISSNLFNCFLTSSRLIKAEDENVISFSKIARENVCEKAYRKLFSNLAELDHFFIESIFFPSLHVNINMKYN